MKKKIVAATMLSFAITLSVSATPTSEIEPYSPNLFTRVELKEDDTKVVLDPHISVIQSSRPNIAPKQQVKVLESKPKTATSNHSIKGVASWYCRAGVSRCTRGHSGGMYAAIRKDLLYLRGKRVNVCGNGNCVVVTIIDCNCGSNANLIDLYSDAFRKLAPLNSGVVRVTVKW